MTSTRRVVKIHVLFNTPRYLHLQDAPALALRKANLTPPLPIPSPSLHLMSILFLLLSLASSVIAGLCVAPSPPNYGDAVATQTLMDSQEFAESWNSPASRNYTPPSESFNRVLIRLDFNTTGMNYDRLAIIYLDDMEIWRTSTSEPDSNTVTWSVTKDLSYYMPVFDDQHEFKVLVQNRVDSKYTGKFFLTATISFFNSDSAMNVDDGWAIDLQQPPTQIQALAKGQGSLYWTAPDDSITASAGSLDRSVNRALLHVFASGNGDDEFWWDKSSPSRFVDVYVGEQLAGFATPFPVVFTGGVNPMLWKPIVSIRAYDLPGYFVDISPFLPDLWNGANVSLKVTNGVDDSKIPSDWLLNMNLFSWATDGQQNEGSTNTPQNTTNGGSSSDLTRSLNTSASLTINGQQQNVSWSQSVHFTNSKNTNSDQTTLLEYSSGESSLNVGQTVRSQSFYYPLQMQSGPGSDCDFQLSYISSGQATVNEWVHSVVYYDGNDLTAQNTSYYVAAADGQNRYAESKNNKLVTLW